MFQSLDGASLVLKCEAKIFQADQAIQKFDFAARLPNVSPGFERTTGQTF